MEAEVTGVVSSDCKTMEEVVPSADKDDMATDKGEQRQEQDPAYAYLDRDEFCSERWKIEVKNLPKQYGFKELKKFLMKMQLSPHKIKKGTSSGYFVFISFKCPEDRDKAIGVLNGCKWKNKVLQAYHANAAKDPLIQKRQAVEPERQQDNGREETEPVDVLIKKATVPWFDVPYDEQLRRKNEKIKTYMTELKGLIKQTNSGLKKHIDNEEWACEDIIPSPVMECYRNKCEFTIGIGHDTGLTTVGFRVASYKKGSKTVGPVRDLQHIPKCVRNMVDEVEKFVQESELAPYDPETHEGVWRQLTVRTNLQEHLLLMLVISPKGLSSDQIKGLKEKIRSYFSPSEMGIRSFYIKFVEAQGHHEKFPAELLFGDTGLTEVMCGLKFRISPDSFFQVNTKAAENLIQAIQLHSKLDEDTCLLDICCGTGTLGLCLAQYCGQVLGVEIIRSAVEDARANATENQLQEKCEFFCGKAEDIIDALTAHTKKKKIMAILDPPRAGVHNKVLQTLRQCSKVDSVIYVSCDADAAKRNFVDLARPESKKYNGDPFVPKHLVPVDLFPMSPHMELVVVLQRVNS